MGLAGPLMPLKMMQPTYSIASLGLRVVWVLPSEPVVAADSALDWVGWRCSRMRALEPCWQAGVPLQMV